MKKTCLVLALSLLSACATSVSSPDQWKMEEGKGFDKENFSVNEYLKQNQDCFAISQRITPNPKHSQKDAYFGCMRTRGYEIVTLSEKQIRERTEALSAHTKLHTPTETNYYDKSNFLDNLFINDMKHCTSNSKSIKAQPNPNFYSSSLIGLLTVHSLAAIEKQNEKYDKRQSYVLNCMFDKGYILKELPAKEKQRRLNLIKNEN